MLRPQPGLPLAQHLEGQVWRVERGPAELRVEHAIRVRWANGVELMGYTLEEQTYRGGQVVPITLAWGSSGALRGPQMVFIHLIGPDDAIWGQQDYVPTRLLGAEEPGHMHFDQAGPILLPDAPAGVYQVKLGWYDVSTLRRIPLIGADDRPLPNDVFTLPVVVKVAP